MEPDRRIDRQRLDVVLADISRTTTDSATRAQIEGFEALLRARHRDWQRSDFTSVREEITDFIMPRIGNASILQSVRYMEILNNVVERILPYLDENDEIISIAVAVIEEEMARHRELQERVHEALGA